MGQYDEAIGVYRDGDEPHAALLARSGAGPRRRVSAKQATGEAARYADLAHEEPSLARARTARARGAGAARLRDRRSARRRWPSASEIRSRRRCCCSPTSSAPPAISTARCGDGSRGATRAASSASGALAPRLSARRHPGAHRSAGRGGRSVPARDRELPAAHAGVREPGHDLLHRRPARRGRPPVRADGGGQSRIAGRLCWRRRRWRRSRNKNAAARWRQRAARCTNSNQNQNRKPTESR